MYKKTVPQHIANLGREKSIFEEERVKQGGEMLAFLRECFREGHSRVFVLWQW